MIKKLSLFIFIFVFLATFVSAYDIEFYHSDNLGSPVVVTDSSGDVKWSADYKSFGAAKNEVGVGDLKYNQKELDDTNLYYYGARYYDSSVGRFITADSYNGEPVNSQSQNKYIYVKNNPLKYTDPTGHKIKPMEGRKTWGNQAANLMNFFFPDKVFEYNKNKGVYIINEFKGGSKEQQQIYSLFKNLIEDSTEFEIAFLNSDQYASGFVPSWNSPTGIHTILVAPVKGSRPLGEGGADISFPYSTIMVHELAHAQGVLPGQTIVWNSEANSVYYENLARTLEGYDLRKFYFAFPDDSTDTDVVWRAGTPDDYDSYLFDKDSTQAVDVDVLKTYASDRFSKEK